MPVPPVIRLGEALDSAAARLWQAGVEAPRREARYLAAHLLGQPAGAWLDPACGIDAHAYAALVGRRAAHEPLAFITGRRGFWTLDLAVSPDTLIPRADSETLIEAAVAHFPVRAGVRRILDLGTGTGCLLLAALAEFPGAWGLGVDIDAAASGLAARNAAATGLARRACFAAGVWADMLGDAARFDLILCNPPYIPSGDIGSLMPEVAKHEPRRALDGGLDGLGAYRRIMPVLARLLQPGGAGVLELGQGQQKAVTALAEASGLVEASCRHDLGGVARALVLTCQAYA